MQLSPETLRFIEENIRTDVRSLALQAKKYPQVDMAISTCGYFFACNAKERTSVRIFSSMKRSVSGDNCINHGFTFGKDKDFIYLCHKQTKHYDESIVF